MVVRGWILGMLFTLLIGGTAHAQPGPGPPLDMPTAEQVTGDYASAVRQLLESKDPGVRIAAHYRLYDVFGKLGRLLLRDVPPAAGGPEFVDPAAEALVRQRIPARELADVGGARERALQNCVAEVRRQHALGDYANQCLAQGHWLPWMFVPLPPAALAVGGSESESAAWFEQRRKELRAQPDDRSLRIDVAAMLVATRDYSEALRVLEPIRRDYAARLLRSRALYATQQIDGALAEVRLAIQQARERPEARLTYASIVVQARADQDAEMSVAGEHFRAALCNLSRAEISRPPSLREELDHLEARLRPWIPPADAWPRCEIRSTSEMESEGPRVVRRIEPFRQPAPQTHRPRAGCGHCNATQSRTEPAMSVLFLVLVLLLRRSRRVPQVLALALLAVGCAGTKKSAQHSGNDWAITQRRSAELHVTLRHGSLPAANAPFLVDISPYEAARVDMNLPRYRTRQRTGSDGRWSDAHFVYHHAHIAVRPQLEHLDELALSWRWPDRWFERISMVIDVDAYRIDYGVRRDGTPQFQLRAGPSQSGTRFLVSFAALQNATAGRWLGDDAEVVIDGRGGSAVMDVSIADLLHAWRSEPEVRALRPDDWIALRVTGYANAVEQSVETVRSARPDDHRGNVPQGQHGDGSLFEPGTELWFERTVRVQVLASDLSQRVAWRSEAAIAMSSRSMASSPEIAKVWTAR